MINRIRNIKGASVDSLLLTFMQIVTYATSMITTKLISVSLSLNDYGTYSSVIVVISVAASFTLLGLGDCLNYYYNNHSICPSKDERITYINSIYLAQSIVGVIVGVILLVGRGFVANYFGNGAVASLLCVVCFKPWFENAIHLFQVLYVSVGKAKIIAIRNFILAALRIVIVFVSLRIYHSLTLVFALLVVVDIIQIAVFGYIFGKDNFWVNPLHGRHSCFKAIFAYSIPMGIYFIMNTLMREIDKLVVGKMGTQEQLAIYTNSSKQLPLNLFVASFATVLVPYIMQFVSEKKGKEASILFKNYMKLGYLTIWMLSGAIIISSAEVIPFLYSDEYLPGMTVFIMYIIVGMLQFASMHLIVAANGDTNYLMKLSMIMLGMNVVFDLVLYLVFERLGNAMIGPALATIIITAIYTICVLKKSIMILHVSFNTLFDLKSVLLYLLQLIVMGIVLFFSKVFLINHGVNRYIAMFGTCVVYCFVILSLHFKEYIEILKIINSYKLKTDTTM